MLEFVLLQAATAAAEGEPQGNSWSFWVMLIAIMLVMWLFMFRPQQKKQKELQQQRDALKKGDKVLTSGGIYGIIKEVQETTFLVEISKDVVIKVDKASIYVAEEEKKEEKKDEKKEDKKEDKK